MLPVASLMFSQAEGRVEIEDDLRLRSCEMMGSVGVPWGDISLTNFPSWPLIKWMLVSSTV